MSRSARKASKKPKATGEKMQESAKAHQEYAKKSQKPADEIEKAGTATAKNDNRRLLDYQDANKAAERIL